MRFLSELMEGTDMATERRPGLHLDLHIHIGADASAAEIDRIFAELARTLRTWPGPTVTGHGGAPDVAGIVANSE